MIKEELIEIADSDLNCNNKDLKKKTKNHREEYMI